MSDEIAEEANDVEEMKQLMAMEAEAKQEKAALETPSPEPAVSQAPEVVEQTPDPVTPKPSEPEQIQTATGKDDPLKWAEKKGFKTPEDMARALLQKEQEFHSSRQKANEPPPQAPQWQPQPQVGYGYAPQPQYGYPPPVPPPDFSRQVAGMYPQLDPDDVRKVMPLIVDAAEAVAFRRTQGLERELTEIKRSSARNNELMNLMRDPAFRDERVQLEIHAVLDSDPSIYQRERDPHAYAFEKALSNLARKQLQKGSTQEPTLTGKPPVTAGGGNGSANTAPQPITDAIVASWTEKEQDAFFKSNGKIIPKR